MWASVYCLEMHLAEFIALIRESVIVDPSHDNVLSAAGVLRTEKVKALSLSLRLSEIGTLSSIDIKRVPQLKAVSLKDVHAHMA